MVTSWSSEDTKQTNSLISLSFSHSSTCTIRCSSNLSDLQWRPNISSSSCPSCSSSSWPRRNQPGCWSTPVPHRCARRSPNLSSTSPSLEMTPPWLRLAGDPALEPGHPTPGDTSGRCSWMLCPRGPWPLLGPAKGPTTASFSEQRHRKPELDGINESLSAFFHSIFVPLSPPLPLIHYSQGVCPVLVTIFCKYIDHTCANFVGGLLSSIKRLLRNRCIRLLVSVNTRRIYLRQLFISQTVTLMSIVSFSSEQVPPLGLSMRYTNSKYWKNDTSPLVKFISQHVCVI